MTGIDARYRSSDYLDRNPTWDEEDSPWKASQVMRILEEHEFVEPPSVCEVGCGAGGVLANLRQHMPSAEMFGFDIAPDAARFWDAHLDKRIHFQVGDFFETNARHYDLMLVLDVLEHVSDPWAFLNRLKGSGECFVFHFPLDLSAVSVLREKPLLHVRRKVGHIHYFTRGLALELLNECGFEVISNHYTGASVSGPRLGLKTRLAGLPRRLAYRFMGDVGVRLLGGETLMVLARAVDS